MQGFSRADRRAHYRVELPAEHQMEVTLIVAADEVRGRLLDVSIGGLAAAFARGSDPHLQPGQRVGARIRLVWLDRTLGLGLVEIRHRTEESDFTRYGIEIADTRILRRQLGASLWPYFNRRAAFRVQPDPASPMLLTLQSEQDILAGPLHDISTGGAAVMLRSDEDLPREAELRIVFAIPGRQSPLQLKGSVRYGISQNERQRYGIQFVEEEDPVFQAQQQDVASYVMHRQQEGLRERKARP